MTLLQIGKEENNLTILDSGPCEQLNNGNLTAFGKEENKNLNVQSLGITASNKGCLSAPDEIRHLKFSVELTY